MKKIVNKITVVGFAGLLCALTTNSLFAQTGVETNTPSLNLSDQIQFQLTEFETNAADIETNQSLDESQKLLDEKMRGMENSVRAAINALRFSRGDMNRKQRAALWFDIFVAIDRHLSTNIPSVDIGGFVQPLPRGSERNLCSSVPVCG
jgi:hypothetical protein